MHPTPAARPPAPGSLPAAPPRPLRRGARPALLGLLLLLSACASPGRDLATAPVPDPPPGPVPDRAPLVDIQHYDVDVDIDHEAGFVRGQVAVRFAALPDRPAATLELDAVDLAVSGAWDAEGRELEHEQRGEVLVIRLAEPLPPGEVGEVTVQYSCFPRRGVYFVPPTGADPHRPWHLWTQGETHEARYWIPCWDLPNDRATHALHVTVDDAFRTMAAGALTDSQYNERTGRRTDTWELDVPHVSYLFTLVAGDLAQGEIPGGPVPLPVLADRDSLLNALVNFSETPDFLTFFGEYTGLPYPYPKYAQCCVHDFTAGGQENISATTLLTETIHDPADEPQKDSTSLIAHEAAHQWFGDYITCADWSHLWLNESFATWFEALQAGHADGEEALRLSILEMRRKVLGATNEHDRPIVWSDYPDPDAMFGVNSYEGGALRLHLLREILGPDAMQRAVARYVQQHGAGVVVTEDLRRSLEESSGKDLQRFFDEWLYGAGFPQFRVRLAEAAPDAPALLIEQTQAGRGWRAVFHLPVTVAWSRGGVEHRQRLEIEAASQTLPLTGTGPLDWVCFDPDAAVPGATDLEQGEAQWRSQLRTAGDPLVRLLAARWFAGDTDVRADLPPGWRPEEASTLALLETVAAGAGAEAGSAAAVSARAAAIPGSAAAAVRIVALTALAVNGAPDDARIGQALIDALASPDTRLREVAASGLALHGGNAAVPSLLNAVADENASVVAAALGALVDRDFPGAFGLCTSVAERTDKYELVLAIVQLVSRIEDDDRVLPFLLAAARWQPVPRVRAAALESLAGLPDPDGVVFRQLGESLNDDSYRVRAAAAHGLGWLPADDPRRDAAMLLLAARRSIENDPSVMQSIAGALQPPE